MFVVQSGIELVTGLDIRTAVTISALKENQKKRRRVCHWDIIKQKMTQNMKRHWEVEVEIEM